MKPNWFESELDEFKFKSRIEWRQEGWVQRCGKPVDCGAGRAQCRAQFCHNGRNSYLAPGSLGSPPLQLASKSTTLTDIFPAGRAWLLNLKIQVNCTALAVVVTHFLGTQCLCRCCLQSVDKHASPLLQSLDESKPLSDLSLMRSCCRRHLLSHVCFPSPAVPHM